MVSKPDTWLLEHTLALSGTASGKAGYRMSSEGLQNVASPFVLVVEDYPDAREMYLGVSEVFWLPRCRSAQW